VKRRPLVWCEENFVCCCKGLKDATLIIIIIIIIIITISFDVVCVPLTDSSLITAAVTLHATEAAAIAVAAGTQLFGSWIEYVDREEEERSWGAVEPAPFHPPIAL
jgi:hypothetical protein